LVFAAAPPAVNSLVVRDAIAAGVWVCSASDPTAGDFTLPAAVRRGAFVLALSTGGAGPGFARRVRKQLDEQFDAAVGEFVGLLAEVRPAALAAVPDPAGRRDLLDRLSDWEWLDRVRRDGVNETRAAMMAEIARAAE
jgi:precorrin-2 dehydrogenase/sirohydrochlorin ferrochelatase